MLCQYESVRLSTEMSMNVSNHHCCFVLIGDRHWDRMEHVEPTILGHGSEIEIYIPPN